MKVSPPAASQIDTEECYFRTRPLNCSAPYTWTTHAAHTDADKLTFKGKLCTCQFCVIYAPVRVPFSLHSAPQRKRQQPLEEHVTLEAPLDLLFHFPSNKAKFLFKSAAHKNPQKQAQIGNRLFFFHKCIINCKKFTFLLLVLYSSVSNLNLPFQTFSDTAPTHQFPTIFIIE